MKRRKKAVRTPGAFLYYGGGVFEVDNCGRDRHRKDIGPFHKGKFKHKFYVPGAPCKR